LEWHEGDPLPEGLTFVKGSLPEDMYIKVCLEQIAPPKISVEKRNIAEIDVDVKGMMKWIFKRMAMLPEDAQRKCDECVRYVKTSYDRFDVEVSSDLSEEKVCFVLPTEWRFKGILKNNVPIPFEISDTNKVCFTVTHASPTLITIQLISDITQMTNISVGSIVGIIALIIIVNLVMMLIKAVKRE
jgi:hypothetical protein